MKPYMNLKGKGYWSWFWEDKVPKWLKKKFKKSQRQINKKLTNEQHH